MKRNNSKVRTLEALENRMLLSASPLDFDVLQPGGALAYQSAEEFTLNAGAQADFQISLPETQMISVLCKTSSAGVYGLAGSGGYETAFTSTNAFLKSYTENTTITVRNQDTLRSGDFSISVLVNAAWESELAGKTNNNLASGAESLTFLTMDSGSLSAARAVVVGGLDADGASDYYTFTAPSTLADIQLRAPSASDVTLELYDSSGTLLANGTTLNDFRSVISSVKLTRGAKYVVRVAGTAGSGSDGQYTLAVASSTILESDTQAAGAGLLSDLNSLSTTGQGAGYVTGASNSGVETVYAKTNETILASAAQGNRMATVSSVAGTSGSVVVRMLENTGETWVEIASAVFTPREMAGFAPQLSLSGDNVLLGNSADDSAYLFSRVGTDFEQVELAVNDLDTFAHYGSSVCAAGDYAVVAAEGGVVGSSHVGSVYIFQKTIGGWGMIQRLDGQTSGAKFGSAVCLDAATGRLYVGATGAKFLPEGSDTPVSTGLVYVYELQTATGTWAAQATIQPEITAKNFGRNLTASENTLVVCSGQGVSIFNWDAAATSWTKLSQFSGTDVDTFAADFGTAVAICGNQIVVTSELTASAAGQNTGSAYLFQKSGSTWNFRQKITPAASGNVSDFLLFGSGVSLTDTRLDVFDSATGKVHSFTGLVTSDTWTLNVTGKTPVSFQLETLDKGTGILVPLLDVYDPDGNLVSVTNSSFTPTKLGTYRFVLSSANDAGAHYLLKITGGTYARLAMVGTATEPVANGLLSSDADEVIVEYTHQVAYSSIATSSAKIGDTNLTFKELRDGNQVVWSLPAGLREGAYTVAVSGIQDVAGNTMRSLSWSFTNDQTTPSVVSAEWVTPSASDTTFLKVKFSEEMARSFNAANVRVTNAAGTTMDVQFAFDAASNTLSISSATLLPNGTYNLWLAGGAGGLCDLAGNPIPTDFTSTGNVDSDGLCTISCTTFESGTQPIATGQAQAAVGFDGDMDDFLIPVAVSSASDVRVILEPSNADIQLSYMLNYDAATGYVTVHVVPASGSALGAYTVHAATNAEFETTQSAISQALTFQNTNASDTTRRAAVIGQFTSGTETDTFSFTLRAGESANLALLTSASDVFATLYDSDGTTAIASGATLENLKNVSGSEKTYYVRLNSSTAGNSYAYKIMTDMNAAAETFAPVLTPADGAALTLFGTSISVEVGSVPQLGALAAGYSSVKIQNSDASTAYTCTGYEIQNDTRVVFQFSGLTLPEGSWQVVIPTGVITTLAGSTQAISGSFSLDNSAPSIVSAQFNSDTSVSVKFSEAVNTSAFTTDTISFVGQKNGVKSVTNAAWDAETNTLNLAFGTLFSDVYTLTLTGISDAAGNTQVLAPITLPLTNQALDLTSDAWQRVVCDGAFARAVAVEGYLGANAANTYTFDVAEGEVLSCVTTVATRVLKDGAAVNTTHPLAAGTYTVEVTQAEGAEAFYTLQILRNAAAETESENTQTLVLAKLADSIFGLDIKQTSVLGSLATAQDTDTYRFTLDANAAVSLGLKSMAEATVTLYEVLANGDRAQLAAGTVPAGGEWSSFIESVRNIHNASCDYIAEITGAAGSYVLFVNQNAQFNAVTVGTLENAFELSTTNTVVGHVSREISYIADATAANSYFGNAVATDGNFLFVGIPGAAANGASSGLVGVYAFDGIGYTLLGTLQGDGASEGDCFGSKIVFKENTLLVTAPGDGTYGTIYMFAQTQTGAWQQTEKIVMPAGVTGSDLTVDYASGRLIVGVQNAAGDAYIFEKTEAGWQYLSVKQGLANLYVENSRLGYSVQMDGDFAVVSAPEAAEVNGQATNGMVYIFHRGESNWQLYNVFCADDTTSEQYCGYSLALDGTRLVVASFKMDPVNGNHLLLATYDLANPGDPILSEFADILQTNLLENSLILDGDTLYVAGQNQDLSQHRLLWQDGTWVLDANGTHTSPLTGEDTIFGRDFATLNGTDFVGAPTAASVGAVWGYDDQSDFYRVTAASQSISVYVSDPRTSVTFFSAEGVPVSVLNVGYDDETSTWTFDNAELGAEYSIQISANTQAGVDYVMSVSGIGQEAASLELLTTSTNGTSTQAPTRLTFTFSDAVRSDQLTSSSLKIFNGVSWFDSMSWNVSSDGKTVTFLLPEVTYFGTEFQWKLDASGVYSRRGAQLGADITRDFTMTSVNVKTRLLATAAQTSAIWTFGAPVTDLGANWAQTVRVTSAKLGEIKNLGEFTLSADGMTLTWTAASPLDIDGDTLTITLLGSRVRTVSGQPLAGLAWNEAQSDFLISKTFVVDMNSQLCGALVVKTPAERTDVLASPEKEVLPESSVWTDEWRDVIAEVWGWVQTSGAQGIREFDAVITYDPTRYVPAMLGDSIVFESTEQFTNVSVVKTSEGTLSVHAETERDDIGDWGARALLVRVRFHAVSPGSVDLNLTSGGLQASETGLALDEIAGVDTDGSSLTGRDETVMESLTKVYPVTYDMNDDGAVDVADLIQFVKCFGESAASSVMAGYCDFDASGEVNVADLILFVKNFGNCVGDSMTFAESYPQTAPAALEAPVAMAAPAALEVVDEAAVASIPRTAEAEGVRLADDRGNVWAVQWQNVFWRDATAGYSVLNPEVRRHSELRAWETFFEENDSREDAPEPLFENDLRIEFP